MAFRISVGMESGARVIRVEGRLDEPGAADLRRFLAGSKRLLPLQLRELRSADEAGLRALREIRASGVPLRSVSPYLALLLDAPTHDPDPATPWALLEAAEPERRRQRSGTARKRNRGRTGDASRRRTSS
jgi:predicted nuclease with RNAse H fold